jgi:tetratricopeptide (TPR) repeat protein
MPVHSFNDFLRFCQYLIEKGRKSNSKEGSEMQKHHLYYLFPVIFIILLTGYFFPRSSYSATHKDWIAKVVSVQGIVQILREGKSQWEPIQLNDLFYPGDTIRVQKRSRAALLLYNETIIRLDQMTTITFSGMEKEKKALINLLSGAAYFFSRIPRSLKVTTPFVNAGVEGTEFFIRVEKDQAVLSVFEGQVAATNQVGSLVLTSGQSALAQPEKAPALSILVRPRDAVQWAVYYPPVLDYQAMDFIKTVKADWEKALQKSMQSYWQGDLTGAFSSLEEVPEPVGESRFFIYRAALLLTVGRVDEAKADIKQVLDLDPSSSHAFALQSIIAVVHNEKDEAHRLASKAVVLDPESSAGRIALSYVNQAHFDLKSALTNLKEAVRLDPKNALAWARLVELYLSVGDLDRALEAAEESVVSNPKLARTQTILGFVYLAQFKIQEARIAFRMAIGLDQAAPLPRLGLGLAKIRQGRLKEGRSEIEIAAALSPNNSLIRSYLGKAYFEENRDKLAKDQFSIAKELDPLDPTPFFYDAIRKQTLNRPVEALEDLQTSIQLNENRAIYRSRLLLDEDLAARSASLARIYNDLGFQQLALVEGWKSLNVDPGNHSAHRFLADLYASLPRHEIARVSETLQSQLLQPINITPVQPQLAESNLYIQEGAGPVYPSFNEFNYLFHRNRFEFQANNVVGKDNIMGNELVHSMVRGWLSYSLGQFHYMTDGFRQNNDLEENIYNAFTQIRLSHKTSIQAELRYTGTKKGDLLLRFNPNEFSPTERDDDRIKSVRFGFHHKFSPHSNVIGSFIYQEGDFDYHLFDGMKIDWTKDEKGYLDEIQYQFVSERLIITSGIGHSNLDQKDIKSLTIFSPPPAPPLVIKMPEEETGIRHTNLYIYSKINYPQKFTWTIGGSADFFEKGSIIDLDQFNPKFGVTWNPFPSITLRAAGFKVLKRMLISNQTLEPTQVAGFNQFFDDTNGTKSWRYGIGLDQRITKRLYWGAEFSERDLKEPITFGTINAERMDVDLHEKLLRTYFYLTPFHWLAVSAEHHYEQFKKDPNDPGAWEVVHVKTHRFPLGINCYHPSGFSARLKATYIYQKGVFGNITTGIEAGEDRFWVVDASFRYRFPERRGLFSIEVKNIFNQKFNYQNMDLAHPLIYPKRLILARFTIGF